RIAAARRPGNCESLTKSIRECLNLLRRYSTRIGHVNRTGPTAK
ncbi:hypothetical protein HMPREF0591_5032, partial [Mycobacterium parascrofulaceum ATCC BAA-614]